MRVHGSTEVPEARRAKPGALEGPEGGEAAGLVLSDISARPGDLWTPRFPSPDLVQAAAAMFTSTATPGASKSAGSGAALAARRWEQQEGPRWRISIAPGVIQIGQRDPARHDRTEERRRHAHQVAVDVAVACGDLDDEPGSGRKAAITEWSAKSRAQMVKTFAQLDYSGMITGDRIPAMITLTLPGDWTAVAPDGQAFKRLVRRFLERWHRAWGARLVGLWKLEFQRRGAPHVHIFTVPPHGSPRSGPAAFRPWLSQVWADVVAHPDLAERARHLLAGTAVDFATGLRSADPKRLAIYFAKHSAADAGQSKEYQHRVPESWRRPDSGPGRFWGYWGLTKALGIVEIASTDAILAARTLRRWSRAQRRTRVVRVYRPVIDWSTGELRDRWRRSTVRAVRLERGRGFICVNDGPVMAGDLARYLDLRRTSVNRSLP